LSAFSSFDFCLSELDGEERDIQSFDFFFFLRKNEGALNFFPIISCFEKLAGEDNEDAGAGPTTSASNPCEGKAFSLYLLCACV